MFPPRWLPGPLYLLGDAAMQLNLHEEVVMARAGKPLVRLMPVMGEPPPRCLGFLAGSARVEAELKRDFEAEINAMSELDEVPFTERP